VARRLNRRTRGERGFTLIEILCVMLIIGVLAAIALPTFLGEQGKGQDAEAKSNARNLVSQVESCYTPTEDYRKCVTEADLGGNLGIPYGTAAGQAEVASAQQTSFTITAVSKAATGGQNNTFTIVRDANGGMTRTCTAGAGNNGGGCKNGTW
jgi:type IV pilus assembly protein PilA